MELQVIEQNAIVAAFANRTTDDLFEQIAKEVRSFVPDVTTKKGRDEIGSLALKVSKSKTLIEKYGKELVAEQKAQIKLVDDDRIAVVKKFDALRDEILAPRNAWEQAEKDRVAKHEKAISDIKHYANNEFLISANSSMIEGAIAALSDQVIDSSFEEFEEQAKLAKFETLELLRKELADTQALEAERAELERLRQAEQERLQREHEERIASEAANKARLEAEQKAKAEAERVERDKRESAEREARLKAEKEAAELRAAQAAQQERERIEREQAAQAEAERQAEAARLANQEHRKQICNEALGGLIALGIDAEKGKEILRAINNGQIPHVSIKF